MKYIATTSCAWSEYNTVAAKIRLQKDPVTRQQLAEAEALPARVRLVANTTSMMYALQQTLSTPGELGTYMNIESHSLVSVLYTPAAELQTWLQNPLPDNATPPKNLNESKQLPSVIVPTARTTIEKSENFELRALVLKYNYCNDGSTVNLNARELGSTGAFQAFPLTLVSDTRCVFTFSSSAPMFQSDFEWYVGANLVGSIANASFPPASPIGSITMTTTVMV